MKINTEKRPTLRNTIQHPLADVVVTLDKDNKIETVCRWKAAPFPLKLWSEIYSFFRSSPSDEVQVRLYYSEELKEWAAHAHPQAGAGLSTKELPDHADAGVRPDADPRFRLCGTNHSHCDIKAFQSGTDEANERSQDGIHITIGKIMSSPIDIHVRAYFSGWQFDVPLTELFGSSQLPLPAIPDGFDTPAVRSAMEDVRSKNHLELYFKPATIPFPDVWSANVIKPVRDTRVWGGMGNVHNGPNGYQHHYHISAENHREYGYGYGFNPILDMMDDVERFDGDDYGFIKFSIESAGKNADNLIERFAALIEGSTALPLRVNGKHIVWAMLVKAMTPAELNAIVTTNDKLKTFAIEASVGDKVDDVPVAGGRWWAAEIEEIRKFGPKHFIEDQAGRFLIERKDYLEFCEYYKMAPDPEILQDIAEWENQPK
jgi:hypothetical protein